MAIISFHFDKITAEKTGAKEGKINIKNNVGITKVEKADFSVGGSKQAALRFKFEFTSTYEPGVGEVKLEGSLIDLREEKAVTDILTGWEKDKKIPEAIMAPILNTVLQKCNVQALILSKEVSLPPSIPLPKVNVNQPAK